MNTFRSLSVLMAGLLMIAVACKPEPQVNVTPVFPELVQDNNVAPGSTMTLTFDANADWEVSVSSENLQWFWIKDGSFKVDKVSGKVAAGDKSPVTVQIGVENMCLISEHSQMLTDLGFDIAPFGTDTIVVNGVPEGYSAEAGKVQTMIGDLMMILAEDHSALPEMMIANMASRFARLGAFSGDPITNPMEAQRLIEQLFACENPEYTSAGRRVMSLIPVEEIDKKF